MLPSLSYIRHLQVSSICQQVDCWLRLLAAAADADADADADRCRSDHSIEFLEKLELVSSEKLNP